MGRQPGDADAMVAALRTAAGKAASRLVWLGTAPLRGSGHFFEAELQRPGAIVYRAAPDDNPWLVKTWRKANPSLDAFPTLRAALEHEAELAKAGDPAIEASFRALRLNLGGSGVDEALLVRAGTWEAVEARTATREGSPVVAVDLASTRMAAAAAVWPSGACDAFGVFPRDPDLTERGRLDRVGGLYERMSALGEIERLGAHTIDIPAMLNEIAERWGIPSVLCADRWREGELRQA